MMSLFSKAICKNFSTRARKNLSLILHEAASCYSVNILLTTQCSAIYVHIEKKSGISLAASSPSHTFYPGSTAPKPCICSNPISHIYFSNKNHKNIKSGFGVTMAKLIFSKIIDIFRTKISLA